MGKSTVSSTSTSRDICWENCKRVLFPPFSFEAIQYFSPEGTYLFAVAVVFVVTVNVVAVAAVIVVVSVSAFAAAAVIASDISAAAVVAG